MIWNDWVTIMDVSIATLCGALVAVAGSVFVSWLGNRKGYKDIDAKIGKLDNTTLSGQHKSIVKEILSELNTKQADLDFRIGDLSNTTLSRQNIDILKTIQNLQDEFKAGKEKEDLKRQQLTGDQSRIEQSIEALSAFSKVMLDLQDKNSTLTHENQQLKQKIARLEEQISEIRSRPEETLDEGQTQHLV